MACRIKEAVGSVKDKITSSSDILLVNNSKTNLSLVYVTMIKLTIREIQAKLKAPVIPIDSMGIDFTPGLHFSWGEYCYQVIQIEDTLAPYSKRTMAAKSLVEPIQAFCKLGDGEWWPVALRKDYHYIFMDQDHGQVQGYMVEGSLY